MTAVVVRCVCHRSQHLTPSAAADLDISACMAGAPAGAKGQLLTLFNHEVSMYRGRYAYEKRAMYQQLASRVARVLQRAQPARGALLPR